MKATFIYDSFVDIEVEYFFIETDNMLFKLSHDMGKVTVVKSYGENKKHEDIGWLPISYHEWVRIPISLKDTSVETLINSIPPEVLL